MGNFKKDLEASKAAVQEFRDFLNVLYYEKFGCCTITEGYDTRGDVYTPKMGFFFEVKHDLQADTTGNFFIEKGGLEKTNSLFYVYVDGSNYHIANTVKLRELCKGRSTIKGGDFKSFDGWLIRRWEFDTISAVHPRRK